MRRPDPCIARLIALIRAALPPPAGVGPVALAPTMGALCQTRFAAGGPASVTAMVPGQGEGLGTVPWAWSALAAAALILPFPLAHLVLRTGPGGQLLARMIPGPRRQMLATTICAIIASVQRLALVAVWTPSGVAGWRAEGAPFWIVTAGCDPYRDIARKPAFADGDRPC